VRGVAPAGATRHSPDGDLASRPGARTGPGGAPVLLADQDRALRDGILVQRGLASLARAERLSTPLSSDALQTAIAACHARAARFEVTDWPRIVSHYDALRPRRRAPMR
jgi:RNA polymerase sigma-70 factor (ECF subfamily)